MSRAHPPLGCGAILAALFAVTVISAVVMSFRVPPVRELARQCRVALMAAPELDGANGRSLNLWFDYETRERRQSRRQTIIVDAERDVTVWSTTHLNYEVAAPEGMVSGTCSMGFSRKLSLTFNSPR